MHLCIAVLGGVLSANMSQAAVKTVFSTLCPSFLLFELPRPRIDLGNLNIGGNLALGQVVTATLQSEPGVCYQTPSRFPQTYYKHYIDWINAIDTCFSLSSASLGPSSEVKTTSLKIPPTVQPSLSLRVCHP